MKGKEREKMMHNTSKIIRNKKLFSFSIFMIVFLASFATAIVFMPFEAKAAPGPTPPTIGPPSYGGWDTGRDGLPVDNCYAQYRDYEVTVTYTDVNGWMDIAGCQFRIGQFGEQPHTTYTTFTYDPVARRFDTTVDGVPRWDINSRAEDAIAIGNDITITWKIQPQWDAVEFSGVDIVFYCEDIGRLSAESEPDFDVFDVVTTLFTKELTSQFGGKPDDRVSTESNIELSFSVRYGSEPNSGQPHEEHAPPKTEFGGVAGYLVAVGGEPVEPEPIGTCEQPKIETGNGIISDITVPSDVNSYTYRLWLEMVDEDYVDGYLTNLDEIVIADKIEIKWLAGQYSGDEGNGIDILFESVKFAYDSEEIGSYQIDYQIQRAGEQSDSASDISDPEFQFEPTIAGYYYVNITGANDLDGHDITSYQQNDTIVLTVNQNISVVKTVNNNGENYITWGANSSTTTKAFAKNLGLTNGDYIYQFNESSGDWSDIAYDVGMDSGGFIISRWDYILIDLDSASSKSHSFAPDTAVDPSQNITTDFNPTNQGYNYITWTNDFTISASDFAADLNLGGNEDIEIGTYAAATNTWNNYNPFLDSIGFPTNDFTINPYDVISIKAQTGRSNFYFDTDNIS